MRFSVIIPLYNKGPYVSKALKSVIDQTFQEFELIVVDDGSSDDSRLVAKSILEGSAVNYHLISQVNSGVSSARNNGVAASHGDFICFLDADDWWSPSFLERMDWLIKEYPEAGIYGTNYYYVKNGSQRICVTTATTGYINFCKVYSDKLQTPLWTGAVCIRRIIFDEFGGFRPHLKLGEDFDLWIKVTLKYKAAFLNEPLSYYFQDADAAWRLVCKLHAPNHNMLWNLDYLEDEEKSNPDYKRLIDRLRTYSLLPYYLSRQYRIFAKQELAKVDWERQSQKIQNLYNSPLFVLKCRHFILRIGSVIKQMIIKHS